MPRAFRLVLSVGLLLAACAESKAGTCRVGPVFTVFETMLGRALEREPEWEQVEVSTVLRPKDDGIEGVRRLAAIDPTAIKCAYHRAFDVYERNLDEGFKAGAIRIVFADDDAAEAFLVEDLTFGMVRVEMKRRRTGSVVTVVYSASALDAVAQRWLNTFDDLPDDLLH